MTGLSSARPALQRAALVSVGLGAAAITWGVIETRLFKLRLATVPVLPVGAAPIKVLHVTDLHMQPGQRDKQAWVADLGDLRPDLIVNTGDNLGHLQGVPPVLRALAPLADVPGVFVLGSNDYFAPRLPQPWKYLLEQGSDKPRAHPKKRLPTDDLVAGFERFGWLNLNNSRASLTVNGTRINFVGVDDPHLGYDTYDTVQGEAVGGDVLTMGVMHAPYMRVVDAMTQDRADILLAGHTHGGQLCLPGGRALVTNCDIPTRYAKGLHQWDAQSNPKLRGQSPIPDDARAWLHVSAGLGAAPMFPLRFMCPPEATLLTLLPRS